MSLTEWFFTWPVLVVAIAVVAAARIWHDHAIGKPRRERERARDRDELA